MFKIKILEHTPNPERVVANAARLCYSNLDIDGLFDKYTDKQNEGMIDRLMSVGHFSPVEHVSFTFGIEGVSRSLLSQLTRHRVASYSAQSQRYVKLDQFQYITPPEIEKDKKLKAIYLNHMQQSQKTYDLLAKGLIDNGRTEKEAIEDARYVFPNACETKIVFTMNARTLINFFELRCCNRSQWEIRELADKMLMECKKIAPSLFKYTGASCMFGRCSEGKMSCGSPRKVSEYDDK